jgi:hypothetical protein
MLDKNNKKSNQEGKQPSQCGCTLKGLFIPDRQCGFAIVALTLFSMMLFSAAYFLGKRHAMAVGQCSVVEQEGYGCENPSELLDMQTYACGKKDIQDKQMKDVRVMRTQKGIV